ncbi:DcrB-related protein [Erwinia sp. MMLR14_017]|uniref:DcrB-related protein n=1 Tax=Erwinia sp. MMLR14_017 TaxID=3093842 RepID=UPI00298FD256|nr:DcrB-related protein [Erwinia sp. MMLR14_017]MDW8847667.1 DcrB-related protein [Erwinia sp. MMLR14_017]
MDKQLCRFSEGEITLPKGYCERTLNTLVDTRSVLPPITISRDKLGNHNNVEEYIASQIGLLQKQMKNWKQGPHEAALLGDNYASGVMITYDFMRPDNVRLYQKQAIFTLDMENLLIFSISKASLLTAEDIQHFRDTLKSFQPCS